MKIKLLFAASICAMALASCCGGNKAANTETGETFKQENMIKIITAYKFIKPEMVEEFIEFTKPIIEASNAEPGCISYTLYQNPSDPTKFMFYEEWKDQDAIDFHFSTEHFELAGSRYDFESAPTILNIYDAAKAN